MMTFIRSLAGRRIYLDSNIFIYAMEGLAPYGPIARALTQLLDDDAAFAETSELSLAECLVKPIRDNNATLVQVYFQTFSRTPNLRVHPVTRDILIESARLRAVTSLKLPDAIHLATAVVGQCDCLITNDSGFGAANASNLAPGMQILPLGQLSA